MSNSSSVNEAELEKKLRSGIESIQDQMDPPLSEAQIVQIKRFLVELFKWNKVYNLTGIKGIDENITKNVLDCLVVSRHIDGLHNLDVGTGAGFPGILLAIAKPNQKWTLLDSNGKKTRFLSQIKHLLGLDNVEVVNSRVEQFENKAQFDGITSRAFDSIPASLKLCERLLSDGKRFFALKGKVLKQDVEHLPKWASIEALIPLNVEGLGEERHLIKVLVNRQE